MSAIADFDFEKWCRNPWGRNPLQSITPQAVAGECLAATLLATGHITSDASVDRNNKSSYASLFTRGMKALEITEKEKMFDVACRLIITATSSCLLDLSETLHRHGYKRQRAYVALVILLLQCVFFLPCFQQCSHGTFEHCCSVMCCSFCIAGQMGLTRPLLLGVCGIVASSKHG